MRRGWESRRRQRIERTIQIKMHAEKEAKYLIKNPLFILGSALYWAEGTKQKEWNVSQLVAFSNMDPMAHEIMLTWTERYLSVSRESLLYEIYIHESADIERAKKYWSSVLHIPNDRIRVYIKRHSPLTKRHNRLAGYNGVLKFVVPRSTDMNRRIAAWVQCVIKFVS